jgi:hypothetical protein
MSQVEAGDDETKEGEKVRVLKKKPLIYGGKNEKKRQ